MAKDQGRYQFAPLAELTGSATAVAMDPRLQKLVAFRQHGQRLLRSASTADDEVPVIAKVTDVAAWEALSEVHAGTTVGATAADGSTIVTARLPRRWASALATRCNCWRRSPSSSTPPAPSHARSM